MQRDGFDTGLGRRRRVLAIGMFDSIHFAKWLQLFADEEIDFCLFPSSPHRRLHPILAGLLSKDSNATFSLNSETKSLSIPLWGMDKVSNNFFRATLLAKSIHDFQPDFLHALELQNAGYVALEAIKKIKGTKPIFVVTNYGSDIFWFSRDPKHRTRLCDLLTEANRYASECNRDVRLAQELGFTGQVLPVQPNAGGFDASVLYADLHPIQERNLIMVKGYQGWVGRAQIALRALEAISAEISDFEIVVFSCNFTTKRLAVRLAKRTGLKVTAYPKAGLRHNEMVESFSRSIIYVGLSLSDGISTSMLEAMAMGAIPVQTNTACCDEWFSDTGVSIRNLTVEDVALGIQKAIGLALTTDSAVKNRQTIRARASREEIAKQALAFYQL